MVAALANLPKKRTLNGVRRVSIKRRQTLKMPSGGATNKAEEVLFTMHAILLHYNLSLMN